VGVRVRASTCHSITSSARCWRRNGTLTPPAPAADLVPSEGELDDYSKGIVEFTCEYVRQKLVPRDKRITRLEARVETLLALLGQNWGGLFKPNKPADVVELPRGFLRRVQNG